MIASLMSVIVNLPLVIGWGNHRLVWKLAWSVLVVVTVGILGSLVQTIF